MNLYLFSTNPLLIYQVCHEHLGDQHWVWCTACFDPDAHAARSLVCSVPPSSSPRAIYEDVRHAIAKGDRHNPRLTQWRTKVSQLAVDWASMGKIDASLRDDLVWWAQKGDAALFRPVLYVIRKDLIGVTRLVSVPASKRAGLGWEYQIHDLAGSEFEVIEY